MRRLLVRPNLSDGCGPLKADCRGALHELVAAVKVPREKVLMIRPEGFLRRVEGGAAVWFCRDAEASRAPRYFIPDGLELPFPSELEAIAPSRFREVSKAM